MKTIVIIFFLFAQVVNAQNLIKDSEDRVPIRCSYIDYDFEGAVNSEIRQWDRGRNLGEDVRKLYEQELKPYLTVVPELLVLNLYYNQQGDLIKIDFRFDKTYLNSFPEERVKNFVNRIKEEIHFENYRYFVDKDDKKRYSINPVILERRTNKPK